MLARKSPYHPRVSHSHRHRSADEASSADGGGRAEVGISREQLLTSYQSSAGGGGEAAERSS